MFPIAFRPRQRLPIARCVPTTSPAFPISIRTADSSDDTGSLSGRVTKNGAGLFGAHVVAFNPRDRRADRQLRAERARAVFDRRADARGRTSSASSRWTMRTSTSFFDAEVPVDLEFPRRLLQTGWSSCPEAATAAAVEVKVVAEMTSAAWLASSDRLCVRCRLAALQAQRPPPRRRRASRSRWARGWRAMDVACGSRRARNGRRHRHAPAVPADGELRAGARRSSARLGVRARRALPVETRRRSLRHAADSSSTLVDDVEGAGSHDRREPLQQIQIEGGVLVGARRAARRATTVPFVRRRRLSSRAPRRADASSRPGCCYLRRRHEAGC